MTSLTYPLSEDEAVVLKLGLTYCPDQEADKFKLVKDMHLFARHLIYKVIYDKDQKGTSIPTFDNSLLENVTIEDLKALQDLMDLWHERNPGEEGLPVTTMEQVPFVTPSWNTPEYIPPRSYKLKSKSFPIPQGNPNI